MIFAPTLQYPENQSTKAAVMLFRELKTASGQLQFIKLINGKTTGISLSGYFTIQN
jgi:hypothetical protein